MGRMRDDGGFDYPPEFQTEITLADGVTTIGCDIQVTDFCDPASFPGSPSFKLTYKVIAYSYNGKSQIGQPPDDLSESLENGGLSLAVKSFCQEYWNFVDGVPVKDEPKPSASEERNQKIKWTLVATGAFAVIWAIIWEPKLLPAVVLAYFGYRFFKNR